MHIITKSRNQIDKGLSVLPFNIDIRFIQRAHLFRTNVIDVTNNENGFKFRLFTCKMTHGLQTMHCNA